MVSAFDTPRSDNLTRPLRSGDNPYLDAFTASLGQGGGEYGNLDSYRVRRELTSRYAWAVPNSAAIATLAAYSPIVEIGAGNGYWAALVEAAGGTVTAYDIRPPSTGLNPYARPPAYTTVIPGGPERAADHKEHTLFLCWPSYETQFATNAVACYEGSTLIYVGESWPGCCASESFFNLLEEEWVCSSRLDLPTWPMMHDDLRVFTRRDDRVLSH